MKDRDRIKIKIQQILMKELEPEEMLLVNYVSVDESDEDKRKAEFDKAVVEEAAKLRLVQLIEDENNMIKKLEEYTKTKNLHKNEFTLSVAKKLEIDGKLSDKQIEATKLNQMCCTQR